MKKTKLQKTGSTICDLKELAQMSWITCLILIFLSIANLGHAQDAFSWTGSRIAGSSDVITNGNLVMAYNMGNPNTNFTVNGVNFRADGGGVLTQLVGSVTIDPTITSQAPYAFGGTTYFGQTNLSGPTDYGLLLSSGRYGNGGTYPITISGLTLGQTYALQIWDGDDRGNGGQNETFADTSMGGNFIGMQNLTGYQIAVGIFTAGGTTETITMSGAAQLNPVQLRQLVAPPSAPTLSAVPGDSLVALKWIPAATATGYNVKRSTTSGSGYVTLPAGGNVTGTNFTDSTAVNGITYYYVVSAINPLGEGPNSAQVVATPSFAALPPASLKAVSGNNQVVLKWSVSTGASGYNVYRSTTNGGPYSVIGNPTGLNNTNYTDATALNGNTYYYVVTALAGITESANSAQATAILLLSGGGCGGHPTFTWTAVDGASSYKVFRGTSSGGESGTPLTTTANSGYIDLSATIGTTYYYYIKPVISGVDGVASSELSILAVPSASIVLNAGASRTIGLGSSALIGGLASGGTAPYTYIWSPAAGLSSTTVATPTASPTATTTYTLTAIDVNGCSAVSSLTLTVTPNAPITWTSGPISSPSDVITTGHLVLANNLGSTNTLLINGVSFNGDPGAPGAVNGGGASAQVPIRNVYDGFGAAGQTGDYSTAVSSARYSAVASANAWNLSLSGLTPGATYYLQFWYSDARGGGASARFQTFDDSLGHTVILQAGLGGSQWAVGTFTAASASELVYVHDAQDRDSCELNLIQLRSSAVPSNTVKITMTPNSGSGGVQVLTWPYGVLQSASQVTGRWTNMTGTNSPFGILPTNPAQFYRVQVQ